MIITVPQIVALVIAGAGLALFAFAFWRLARRWVVIKIRVPLLKRFRYRPKRPKADHYLIDDTA